MTFKKFYDEYVIPFVKKVLPDLVVDALKGFAKTVGKFLWGRLLATLFAISLGGLIVETVYVVHIVSVADRVVATASADLAKTKSELANALSDLERTRGYLDGSQKAVRSQQRTLTELQGKLAKLSQSGSRLTDLSGQVEAGQHDLAGLIDRSLQLTRLAQQQAGKPTVANQ